MNDIPLPNTGIDADTLNKLVGFFLPLLISVIVQPHWSKRKRRGWTVAVCIAVGLFVALLQGNLDLSQLSRSVVTVLAFAVGAYNLVWKPTGAAPAIENATDLRGVVEDFAEPQNGGKKNQGDQ